MPSLRAHWPCQNSLTSLVILVIIIISASLIIFLSGFSHQAPFGWRVQGKRTPPQHAWRRTRVSALERCSAEAETVGASVYPSRTSDAKVELHVHHRYRRPCCGTTTRMVDNFFFFLSFFLSFFVFSFFVFRGPLFTGLPTRPCQPWCCCVLIPLRLNHCPPRILSFFLHLVFAMRVFFSPALHARGL